MVEIKFGTDGWRGRIAEDYTFDSVRRCAQGFAHYLDKEGVSGQGVVIGHDKRFQAEYFAAAAAEVMAGNGIMSGSPMEPCPLPQSLIQSLINRQAAQSI